METAFGGLNMLGMGELERTDFKYLNDWLRIISESWYYASFAFRIRDVEVSRPCWIRRQKNFTNEDPEAGQTSTAQFDLNGCKEKNKTSSVREKPRFDGSGSSLFFYLLFIIK
ncbi:hypothetical protein EUGRSUZ_B02111 [Eucalyptus grandis]|uniref:Uncharacterized protein n=2 Tax=Eucalyptus grandis TaxID=71139 RepID=A0ACC3LSG7_EUCGR|nr:hypothetical protein EUGRSUZ_B02111 [Eucalyptus grandis]